MSETGPKRGKLVYREMTVALLREQKEADAVEVAFSESARFYKLARQNPKFETILRRLREAMKRKIGIRVVVDFPEGDVIEDVQAGNGGSTTQ